MIWGYGSTPIFGGPPIYLETLQYLKLKTLKKVVVKRDVSIHHCVPSTNRMLLKQSTCEEFLDNLSLMRI